MNKFKESCLSRKRGRAEIISLVLYVVLVSVISYFHEPWFDEAQAWLIARSASIKEILFEIPHYEGHPPLWHLILVPFAKAGLPFHLSISIINISFCTAAVALLLFKSPFPKVIRCTLPFTFFVFYQYGVINRPYCIMMLAFMLLAVNYKGRNEKPWRYVLSLILLCFTSMMGIIIAGGMCIVWTFEIISELCRNKKIKSFYLDHRFHSLCFILLCAVLLIVSVIPAEDCYYAGVDDGTLLDYIKYLPNLLSIVFQPAESWISTIMNARYNPINYKDITFWISCLMGVCIWFVLIAFTKKNRKLSIFLVPYVPYVLFLAYGYFSVHHLGIGTAFHIFIFWIMADDNMQIPDIFKKLASKINSNLIKKICVIGTASLYGVTIAFSVVSSVNEIKYEYAAVSIADFIKENDLEDAKIMVSWDVDVVFDEEENDDEDMFQVFDTMFSQFAMPSNCGKVTANRTNITGFGTMLLPYFDENIFMNYNVSCPDDLYMHYSYKEDTEKVFESWREKGLPDFIIDYSYIQEVYDRETIENVRYVVIAEFPYSVNFKFHTADNRMYVYMREDLFDEYPQFSELYSPALAGEYDASLDYGE